jgi:hypothetical protein
VLQTEVEQALAEMTPGVGAERGDSANSGPPPA